MPPHVAIFENVMSTPGSAQTPFLRGSWDQAPVLTNHFFFLFLRDNESLQMLGSSVTVDGFD